MQVIKITCDNPKCPGHPDLDETDRTGWLFMNYEVYGQPTNQAVFGSADCVAEAAANAPDPKPGIVQVFDGVEPAQTMGAFPPASLPAPEGASG